MAIAVMYDLPGMTHQRCGGLMRGINFDRRRPTELTIHAAWEKEDGSGWQIFEMWESSQAFETFLQQKFAHFMRGRVRSFGLETLSANVRQTYAGG